MYPQMKLRHYDCADWHSMQKHIAQRGTVQEVRKAAAGPAEPGVSAEDPGTQAGSAKAD
jgi:hypothetical protein